MKSNGFTKFTNNARFLSFRYMPDKAGDGLGCATPSLYFVFRQPRQRQHFVSFPSWIFLQIDYLSSPDQPARSSTFGGIKKYRRKPRKP